MAIDITFEFFLAIFAAVLLVCGLYTYYMTDKLYTQAVSLYAETVILLQNLEQQKKDTQT